MSYNYTINTAWHETWAWRVQRAHVNLQICVNSITFPEDGNGKILGHCYTYWLKQLHLVIYYEMLLWAKQTPELQLWCRCFYLGGTASWKPRGGEVTQRRGRRTEAATLRRSTPQWSSPWMCRRRLSLKKRREQWRIRTTLEKDPKNKIKVLRIKS